MAIAALEGVKEARQFLFISLGTKNSYRNQVILSNYLKIKKNYPPMADCDQFDVSFGGHTLS